MEESIPKDTDDWIQSMQLDFFSNDYPIDTTDREIDDESLEFDQLGSTIQSIMTSCNNALEIHKAEILKRKNLAPSNNRSTKRLKAEYAFPFEDLPADCLISILNFSIDDYVQSNTITKAYVNFDDFMINIILALPKSFKHLVCEPKKKKELKEYLQAALQNKGSLLERGAKKESLAQLNNIRKIIRYEPKPRELTLLALPNHLVLKIFKWVISTPVLNLSNEKLLDLYKKERINLNSLRLTCKKFGTLMPELIVKIEKKFPKILDINLALTLRLDIGQEGSKDWPAPLETLLKVVGLLKAGANLDTWVYRDISAGDALLINFGKRYTKIAPIVISKIKNLNAQDSKGDTYLTKAIRSKSFDLVLELLKYNPDTKLTDDAGNTPLIIAAQCYRLDDHNQWLGIIKLLLERGADINAQNNEGETALMQIKVNWNLELLTLFQQYNADPNLQDKNGFTALIKMTSYPGKNGGQMRLMKYKHILEQLVQMGVDLDAINNNGNNVDHFATPSEKRILSEIRRNKTLA